MTARRRAILIVALAVLLLAIIIFAILYFWPKAPAPAAAPAPAPTAQAPSPTPAVSDAPDALSPTTVTAAPAGSTAAAQMAELFAQRYGSYSNQGDFQNLRDLLPVMTASYRAKTEAYLATATPSDVANYQGVTSVKVTTQVRAYSATAGTATVAVNLQQQKSVAGSTSPAVSYRSLKMTLKLVGKDWRVDSATWEN